MPPISQLVRAPEEGRFSHSEPFAPIRQGTNLPVEDPMLPVFNIKLRCPMPAIGSVSPDSLRQFYRPGMNQMRVLTSK